MARSPARRWIWRLRYATPCAILGVPLTSALRFASTEPAEFLGLGTILGRLAPAFRADMVAFDPESIEVLDTWVAGQAADKK